MKKLILIASILLGFFSTVHAQSAGTAPSDTWKDIKLGAVFTPGLSANVGTVANGIKTDATDFSWALGALADFPFSPTAGLQVGLCYDNRTVGFHDQATGDTSITYTLSYFSIRPELRLGDFVVGIGLGVPIGVSTSASADATNLNKAQSLGASAMNFLLEGRIGAAVPIVEMDNGNELKFHVEASYAFTQIVSSPLVPNDNNVSNKAANNGPIAALQLGLSYLFDLNPR